MGCDNTMIGATAMPKRTACTRRLSSNTASKLARGVVFLARDPVHARLLPEGAAESIERLCVASGVLKPWMVRLLAARWYRGFMMRLVEQLMPGEFMRLTLRKRFVDDEVHAAIDEGVRQLLIVGAGFDTLGLRMAAAYPAVTVVEVDTPATADRRRSAIDTMNARLSNHHLLSVDLARSSLRDAVGTVVDWRTDGRTVAVAEGVVMYLAEAEVAAFLREIRELSGPGTRLVFTYLRADAAGRPTIGRLTGLLRLSLKLVGEPFRWGVQTGALEPFLERAGFRLSGPPERFDLRERYLVPKGIDQSVGKAELMAVAEVM